MKKLIYHLGKPNEKEELKLNFSDGISHTIQERIELGFIPMKIPIVDDAPYRIFNSMNRYREWTNKSLPRWLGYYR